MAKAEISEIIPVGLESFYKTISSFEDYPEFVEGCTGVEVDRSQQNSGSGTVRAKYKVSLFKDIWYTLDHKIDPTFKRLEWVLVDSDVFKVNNGLWELKPLSERQTEVSYSLEVDFKIPVPGLILNRLVKGNLPSMLKSFRKRAESKV